MQRDFTPFINALSEYQLNTTLRPDGQTLLTLCNAKGKAIYRRVLQNEMTDEQLISRIKLDLLMKEPQEQRDLRVALQDIEMQTYTTRKLHKTRWERLWEDRKLERPEKPGHS